MQDYPHHYRAAGRATTDSTVTVSSAGLPDLDTTPPPEFGGPEGSWSPETLLVASVADCFILTFRAIARASKLDWNTIDCAAEGTLDRVDGVTRFTRFDLHAKLELPPGVDRDKADRLLRKAEAVCLITASLNTENHLETEITGG
jgi:organic hydroperoxide reductase OsmC/OhrA